MADNETTAAIGAIAAGVAIAIKEGAVWIVKAIRGNTKAQLTRAKAEDDARTEQREREIAEKAESRILRAIDDLGAKVERTNMRAHENRETLVKVETELKNQGEWLKNLTEDMRVVKRRSTGRHGGED